MPENIDLKYEILRLNDNQAASFGEHLYARLRENDGASVESRRSQSEHTDFIVNGTRIDVKTTRTESSLDESDCPYKYTASGVYCATVTFLKNKIALRSQDDWTKEISYQAAEPYWRDWKNGHKIIRGNNSTLKVERLLLKDRIKQRLETALGFKIYLVIRGMENLDRKGSSFSGKAENPGNLSYQSITKGERIAVYIRLKSNLLDFYDGACLSVNDLEQAHNAAIKDGAKPAYGYRFSQPPLLPLEYSWGTEKLQNTLMVSVEDARRNSSQYPQVLFGTNSLEEFEQAIIKLYAAKEAHQAR